jgi:hypothetical protein
MKQYKIYKHPIGTTVAVKLGWSWPAFFFDAFWAIVKKMWGFGIGFFMLSLVLGTMLGFAGAGQAGEGFLYLVSFIMKFIFGTYGNSWLIDELESRGYEHLDTVTAANRDGALALFLKTQK